MTYAFRVFAAIYGHTVVEKQNAEVQCFYGRTPPTNSGSRLFQIPALYQAERKYEEDAFLRHRYAGQDLFLFHGIDPATGRPDWLAEIFLWLSNEYEAGISVRDEIKRIPYSETVFHRSGLSPFRPHASLLMAWMENAIRQGDTTEALPKAPSPVKDVEHLIVCSHDIDFYFTNRTSALVRLGKNLCIALIGYRSWSYFADNLHMMVQLLVGRRVGDYLPALMEAGSQHKFQSTFFAVARNGHRRDPDYRIEQISSQLRCAAIGGFSVGLHGSYRSVVEDRSLAEEANCLRKNAGQQVISSRQHWLRFSRHRDLFDAVATAGMLVDSSLGFPDMVGFRNGAAFAFPPYDFEREAPHSFLEIPLVLMDGSLQAASRQLHTPADVLAEQVLGESRDLGWGGVSVLWHNPIESLSVPAEVNEVFWKCVKKQSEFHEKWMSVEQFLSASIHRYQRAGLLEGIRIDPQPPT
ncbi:MAG TPA: hypothetical protein VN025_20560 [Candidatus Dormibacteraeota bacterium]|jgi:hypothetical protein|nr:hypothetical protein [Candidatus Dormibacteraeota bacterium]